MTLYKNFGNELRAGGAARAVGARIEKCTTGPGGVATVEVLDAETQKIVMRGAQNLEASPVGSWNRYKMANVSVPKAAAGATGAAAGANAQGAQPILELTYTGQGGTLTERVKFKLAADPILVYVKEPEGTVPGLWDPCLELVMPDDEGITFYIGAQNFTEKPRLPEFSASDANIQAEFEPYDDRRLPNLYIFKVKLSNTLKAESPYGQWPLEHKLNISVENDYGERAERDIRLLMWPEGISFDTRKIKSGRVRKNSVLVDTGDILKSESVDYNIEGATMEVAVAYKDEQGRVMVTRPEEPRDDEYLRLEGTDEASEKVLNPDDKSSNSRVWYTLAYLHKPSYTRDERLGTLSLTPLMPFATEQADTEFHGSYGLSFEKGAYRCDAKATFDIKGISVKGYEENRQKLIKEIYKILAAFRLDDWTRVDNVLARYGAEAERERERLGTSEQRERAAQSSTELLKSIKDIQSVQRLNAIRKMVYEVCNVTCTHESAQAKSEADLYNALYVTACCVRWANDIAFECWWRAVIKNKGASDAAIGLMTPLKKYIEGYLEVLGLYMFDSDVDISLNKYFTWQSAYEKLFCEYAEGYITDLVTDAITGKGLALVKDPRTYAALGGIGAFLFLKHAPSHWKTDEATGHSEFDLWGALKDTMNDFTLSSIKIVFSLVLAWALKRVNAKDKKDLVTSGMRKLDGAVSGIFGWCLKNTFSEDMVKTIMKQADWQSKVWENIVGCDFVNNLVEEKGTKPATNAVGNVLATLAR